MLSADAMAARAKRKHPSKVFMTGSYGVKRFRCRSGSSCLCKDGWMDGLTLHNLGSSRPLIYISISSGLKGD